MGCSAWAASVVSESKTCRPSATSAAPCLPEHQHRSVPQYGAASRKAAPKGCLVLAKALHAAGSPSRWAPHSVEGLQVAALVAGAGFAQACAELGASALWRDDASDTVEHRKPGGDPSAVRRVEEAMTLEPDLS